MEEMTKHGRIGVAAMKAGMDRKTARKYLESGQLPSEQRKDRTYRTRPNPFEDHWPELVAKLTEAPGLQAKTLLDDLIERYPEQYNDGHLRTLQRHVRQWRAQAGPERDVSLPQRHRPGEGAQLDFTDARELGVTIAGQVLAQLLCVLVLPYSNWTWATVCFSESLAALRRGLQRALFQLGRLPRYLQTDNSTAATHKIPPGKHAKDSKSGRTFNRDYLALVRHFGLEARTTAVGAKEQNGDVEARNGKLKSRLEQALLMRGSRDFDSREEWQAFVDAVNRKQNAARQPRVAEELSQMRELSVSKLPEYSEVSARVSEWGTIRIQYNGYSVPSRLIGHELRVRIYEDHIDGYFAGQREFSYERLKGRGGRRIDYRHVIWSLVRKPGGFERYKYREEMFPSRTFRQAYDAIHSPHAGTAGDLAYLRILHLAATTVEHEVELALRTLLEQDKPIEVERVKELVHVPTPTVPELTKPSVDLAGYDALLAEVGT